MSITVRRGIIAFALVEAAAVCGTSPEPLVDAATPASTAKSTKGLVLLTREGCMNTTTMGANLDQALNALGLPADYQFIETDSLADNDVRRGYPTPTLLYKDRDVFGMAEPTASHRAAT